MDTSLVARTVAATDDHYLAVLMVVQLADKLVGSKAVVLAVMLVAY
jgi:hypothetical protein